MQIDKKYLSGYNQITSEIIADSIQRNGARLTTFILKFPRIVLAEFNTHRVLSRNSASSRAIPFAKMLERVKSDPFVPIAFQKDHSGMQGAEYFEEVKLVDSIEAWLDARDAAVESAENLAEIGVTKQIVNRVLEPFLYHTVITTSAEWENFFALRAHEAAEIHISDLAEKMLDNYNLSEPTLLSDNDWHIPFGLDMPDVPQEDKIKIAVARCARVSYDSFEGSNDVNKDYKLTDRLASMGHWSPFEHVAKPNNTSLTNMGGNFGEDWVQLRKTYAGENKKDPRISK